MDVKEAIARLKDHFSVHDDGRPTPKLDEAVSIVIKATEKQIAKKPIINNIWSVAKCPCCDAELGEYVNDGYPKNWESLKFCDCGQKLDWSDV